MAGFEKWSALAVIGMGVFVAWAMNREADAPLREDMAAMSERAEAKRDLERIAATREAGRDAAKTRISGKAAVVDGDTLEIAGTRIRLVNVDACERGQRALRANGTPVDCGAWAAGELAGLIDGGRVECAGAGSDRYGRMLAECFVSGEISINAVLVETGAAFAWPFAKTGPDYTDAERVAERNGFGVWSFQKVVKPWTYRKTKS